MTNLDSITRRHFLTRAASAGAVIVASPLAARLANAASDTDGPQYKIGIYTRPWGKYDYQVALDAIATAGYKYVGLMSTKPKDGKKWTFVISADTTLEEARQVGKEVRERGLIASSAYCGPIPVAKSLEAGIAGLRRIIDNCAAAGVKSLLMGGIGNVKLYDRYYKAVAECCDYAADKKIPITVKPHGGLNSTGSQCRKCIEIVGHSNFSLWYDPGNIFYYSNGELDPVDDAKTVAGLVKVGMCIKDFTMTVKDGKPTRDVLITPGTGRVNFSKGLRVLKKGGFNGGDLVIECLTPGDGGLDTLLAEAKKARRNCERFVAGI